MRLYGDSLDFFLFREFSHLRCLAQAMEIHITYGYAVNLSCIIIDDFGQDL